MGYSIDRNLNALALRQTLAYQATHAGLLPTGHTTLGHLVDVRLARHERNEVRFDRFHPSWAAIIHDYLNRPGQVPPVVKPHQPPPDYPVVVVCPPPGHNPPTGAVPEPATGVVLGCVLVAAGLAVMLDAWACARFGGRA